MIVADFSLTVPTTTDGRDPCVFTPRGGMDYPAIAYAAWLDAQLTSHNLDSVLTDLAQITARLESGDRWLATHDATDPAYPRAIALRNELNHRADALAVQRECLARVVWVACCNVYAALSHLGTTPDATWQLIRGHDPPPGSWPPSNAEWIVGGRPAPRFVATWQIPELVEQLAERSTA